jgi:NADH-quinone oxidoreductase subunit N
MFLRGFGGAAEAWVPAVLTVTTLTLVVGNLMAIPQSNVKRLLAFSGVAHIGYMLIALAIGTPRRRAYCSSTWRATRSRTSARSWWSTPWAAATPTSRFPLFNGFSRRSPGLAACLLIFLLSLAGIPFVVGFWAKLYVFIEAWRAGLWWLTLLGALLAVVGLWYYLQIAYAAYIRAPADDRTQPVRLDPRTRLAVAVCLIAVVGMGAWPAPFITNALDAAAVFLK